MSEIVSFVELTISRWRCKLIHRKHIWRHLVHHSYAYHCDYCGNQWLEDDA